MATSTDRYGSALLALTTRRPPDTTRGSSILHLDLTLPKVVAVQVALWETGGRLPLDPRSAAALLWSLPVAQWLNGHSEAWLDVPGVKALLPGLEALMATDLETWPESRAALRTFVAARIADRTWTEATTKSTLETVDLLNDLVLIFKFAAVGQRRPLRTVAELYRLARSLTTTTDVPSTRAEVIGYLSAPLVSPRALTSLPGPGGPRRPTPGPITDPGPRNPWDAVGELPDRVLARLSNELNEIEARDRASRVRTALNEAGVVDSQSVARLMRALGGEAAALSSLSVSPAVRVAVPLPTSAAPVASRIVRSTLYGAPVLLDVGEASARIARQRSALAKRIVDTLPTALRQRLLATGLALETLTVWPDIVQAATQTPSYLEPIGRSDLLLVRQTTTGYRRAEIAYVENVLIGETRNREHTSRVLTRQEFFESTTRETEETRDLQVTDRAELSREVNKVVSDDLKAQGSVEVTSRGPTQVVASAGVSFEHSTEEAARSAESYSRETIERAVKRTMERITRETRSLFEQETTELNRHGFERDGNATEHVSGVYQYLERVSRARMFWYGERELYDILIPEPASLIWQFATTRTEVHLTVDQPDEALFRSLTIANIAAKREDVIRAFRVTDMPAIPPESLETSMSFAATGSGDDAHHANSKELQIPEGYVVASAKFVASAEVEDSSNKPNGGVTVAGEVSLWEMTLSGNKGSTTHSFTFVPALSGPTVSVAMNADNFNSLVASITLQLKLTTEARDSWALQAYGRVAERYEQLRREYAQAVIQATANQPAGSVSLPDGARAQLNQVVRAELQRAAVDVMRNLPVSFDLIADFGYANPDGSLGSHPVSDLAALRVSEPEIRFLQQAFEWEHLAWVLYPYFWGRRSEWSRTVVVSHPDPDFAAFLNAGAARVQIPVRPGFEDLVKHFMETGEVYEGNGLPKMGDPGYVPFIDEQLTSLGAPGEEVPWPPSAPRAWDIVSPTSLVLVRPAQAPLPTWDPETGAES